MVGAKLSKVIIDGGSSLNVIFIDTLRKMGGDLHKQIQPSNAPFYGIVLGNAAQPLGQITLLITFGTRENYHSEFLKFEVADFETSYHAIFGRPTLTKFMAIPNYTYLVLKMLGPNGVLSLKGDLQKSYECDNAAVALAEA